MRDKGSEKIVDYRLTNDTQTNDEEYKGKNADNCECVESIVHYWRMMEMRRGREEKRREEKKRRREGKRRKENKRDEGKR